MRGRMRGRGRGHLGGEREGGRKWAVSLDPLLKSLSLPLLLFFFWYYSSCRTFFKYLFIESFPSNIFAFVPMEQIIYICKN